MKNLVLLITLLFAPALLLHAQSGDVAPNENLVAEGIPKIPAAIAEAAERYTEFRFGLFSGLASVAARDSD